MTGLQTEAPIAAQVVGLPPTIYLFVFLAPSPEGRRRPATMELGDCLLATSEGIDAWSTDRGMDAWTAAAREARLTGRADGWPTEPGFWVWGGRIEQRRHGPILAPGAWARPTVYQVQLLSEGKAPFGVAPIRVASHAAGGA